MTDPDLSPAEAALPAITLSRVLAAPRDLVWSVLTDPRHIAVFWGPRGFTTTTTEMDLRPGGIWRYVMHGDGADYANWVRYTRVEAPALLTYDHGGDDPDHAEFRARIALVAEAPDRTRITLRLIFDTAEARDRTARFGAEAGGEQMLERLGEVVTASATDLVLTRIVNVPRGLVWRAWTEPELLKQWFCPRPWATTDCRLDLIPGGEFFTRMQGPGGEEGGGSGCVLEVVAERRLAWTSALLPGFRPPPPTVKESGDAAGGMEPFAFTAIITLEDHGGRTRYTARVLHADPDGRSRHEAMGFHLGWGTALDQLVEVAAGLA